MSSESVRLTPINPIQYSLQSAPSQPDATDPETELLWPPNNQRTVSLITLTSTSYYSLHSRYFATKIGARTATLLLILCGKSDICFESFSKDGVNLKGRGYSAWRSI